jgi:CubicO group peptidase (beta-lactamase class C family)
MQEHIRTPSRLGSSTFRLRERPEIAARLPQMAVRSPAGSLMESDAFTEPLKSATRGMGGGGMYSSASDCMKLLMALLQNDGTLLAKDSVAELLKLLVKDSAYSADQSNADIFGNIWPKGAKVKCNRSLGGLVNMEDLSTGRRKSSMMWYGGPMIAWVNRERSPAF